MDLGETIVMKGRRYLVLLGFILACNAAGSIGSIATYPNIPGWYASLEKPFFSPPNWLFAPVWTTLFTLMGISLFLVWRSTGFQGKGGAQALYVFIAQMALNVLWSFLFFGLRSPLYGLLGIIPLWLAILYTIMKFRRIDRRAGFLLVPYLAWVTIATLLNISIFLLNP
ncbi:MAG: TspO/MBR family protein [Candidatus Aenigmatarchaeota archaeon]